MIFQCLHENWNLMGETSDQNIHAQWNIKHFKMIYIREYRSEIYSGFISDISFVRKSSDSVRNSRPSDLKLQCKYHWLLEISLRKKKQNFDMGKI